ncbi:MAG: hypothetical protein ACYDH5_04140 [Acidimicrobiales bacterium]
MPDIPPGAPTPGAPTPGAPTPGAPTPGTPPAGTPPPGRTAVAIAAKPRADIAPRNLRSDRWWLAPVVTFTILSAFVVYGTWVAFQNANYYAAPYLSPFYSPCLARDCTYATLPIVGPWWKLSPALLVLPFPLGFRLTCYYYRRAYYRSFWFSPPACAVPDVKAGYSGETRFPLLLQNLHRYFLYASILVALVLTWDAIIAFRFPSGIGIGVGTVIMVVNAALIWGYTLGCHSCRHLCGGRLNLMSKAPRRYWAWKQVSKLNARHMQLAWASLVWIAFTDLYIRLVAMGVITDPRIIF